MPGPIDLLYTTIPVQASEPRRRPAGHGVADGDRLARRCRVAPHLISDQRIPGNDHVSRFL
jgi:hypothetical protein